MAAPLEYVINLAEAGLAEMRTLIFELRPESLAAEGLIGALTKQVTVLRTRYKLVVDVQLGECSAQVHGFVAGADGVDSEFRGCVAGDDEATSAREQRGREVEEAPAIRLTRSAIIQRFAVSTFPRPGSRAASDCSSQKRS